MGGCVTQVRDVTRSLGSEALELASEALSVAFQHLDVAAGHLDGHEHAAAVQLRLDVGDSVRRLRNLRIFADR